MAPSITSAIAPAKHAPAVARERVDDDRPLEEGHGPAEQHDRMRHPPPRVFRIAHRAIDDEGEVRLRAALVQLVHALRALHE